MATSCASEYQKKCSIEIQSILKSTKCGKCEAETVIAFCPQCRFICKDCKDLHLRWRELRSHEVVAIKDGTQFHDDALLTSSALLIFSDIKQTLRKIEDCYKKFDAREKEIIDKQREVEVNISEDVKAILEIVKQQRTQLMSTLKCKTQGVLSKLNEERKEVEKVEQILCRSLHTAICSLTKSQQEQTMEKACEDLKTARAKLQELPLLPTVRPYMALIDTDDIKEACSSFGNISNTVLCAEKSLASGDSLIFAQISESTAVTVHPKDNEGKEYTTQVQVTAELIHDGTKSSDAPCIVEMQSKSQYSVTYKPLQTGKHSLRLCIVDSKGRSGDIQGSPFAVSVQPTTKFFQSAEHCHSLSDLKIPTSITTNSKGDILVVEQGNHCITMFSADYAKKDSFSSHGPSEGQLWIPHSIAIDEDNNIYVTDRENRVQKFTSKGEFIAKVGSKGKGELQFSNPMGIAYNDGKVYVCDSDNSRIVILNTDLTSHDSFSTASGDRGNELRYPIDIAFDHAGNIYVTEYYYASKLNPTKYYSVHQFSASKESIKLIEKMTDSLRLSDPQGIAFDWSDAMFIAETGHNCVTIYNNRHDYVISCEQSLRGHFRKPQAIHVDKKDKIYIADTGKNRVHIYH